MPVDPARLAACFDAAADLDAPANLAFDGSGRALVVNHVEQREVRGQVGEGGVFLDDAGDPLERPALP